MKPQVAIHVALIAILALTLLPFVFLVDNSLRTNSELNHSFFGLPKALTRMAAALGKPTVEIDREDAKGRIVGSQSVPAVEGERVLSGKLFQSYSYAWEILRGYTVNTLLVSLVTVLGVLTLGSSAAYVFSRYRFPGRNALFLGVLSLMMIPGVLTLVPSFMLVKKLGLLNSYWVLILPYIAGGQIFALFLFKSFFDGLPNELFESARIDGAGHFALYWRLVLPLSKQVLAVVAVVNVLGTWNNFLWPFITNSDTKYHVVASGLYLMGQSQLSSNYAAMYAAYVLSSVPLLVLFVYATKPFIAGVTSGAFKA